MPEHTIARYVDAEISTEDCSIAVIKQEEPLVHGDCNVLRLKLTDTPPDGALICVRYVNMATRNCYNDIYREITDGMEIAIPNNKELFFKCQSIKISFSIEADGCKKSSPSPADIQIVPLTRVQEYAGETAIKLISELFDAGKAAQEAADKANAVLKEIENNGGLLSSEQIGEAINSYLENNPLKESDPTVPDWAKQKEKPEYTADEVGAISTDDLQNAIDTALAQAKASGEFDGKDGADGEKGEKGDTGEQGKAGANGFSPQVTVTEITGGHKINIADTYGTKTFNVMDGEQGEKGDTGDDYVLTDTDRTEIAKMAAELVEVPNENGGSGLSVTDAKVGQIIRIAEVDEDGIPTAWIPVDFPNGDGETWETIYEETLAEDVLYVDLSDLSPLKKCLICIEAVGAASNSDDVSGNGAIGINGHNYFYSPNLLQKNGVRRWVVSKVEVSGSTKYHLSTGNNNNSYQTSGSVHNGYFGDGSPIASVKIWTGGGGVVKYIGAGSKISIYGVKA